MSEDKPDEKITSTASETESRVNTVYLMRIQGIRRKQIIQYCTEKYNVSERQTDTYIARAKEMQGEDENEDVSARRTDILSRLSDLYQRNLKNEDYRECRNILNQIAEILGVKAPTKTDITTNGQSINIISLGDGVNPEDEVTT